MAYTGPYSLSARCGSEIISAIIFSFCGLSIFANNNLPKTKGNAMGFGWVAFGFSLSVAFPIVILGHISAWGNPAVVLGLWISGVLGPVDFVAYSFCQLLGAFIGSMLMWLAFLPHFKTVPEPPPDDVEETLLRSRDYVASPVLNIASYDTRREDDVFRSVKNARYFLLPDKHKVDGDIETGMTRKRCLLKLVDLPAAALRKLSPAELEEPSMKGGSNGPHEPSKSHHLCELYTAAKVADENAKLTAFTTRPAIFSPVFNWLTEFMVTTGIVFGAMWIAVAQPRLLPPSAGPEISLIAGFEIAFLFFVFSLGLAGPTGLAGNPARDLGPRFAHWILPISGKGSTEWFYAWVPFTATLCGGAAGGGLYVLASKMDIDYPTS